MVVIAPTIKLNNGKEIPAMGLGELKILKVLENSMKKISKLTKTHFHSLQAPGT